ncbi:MAG: serine/threonine-protein kinase [Bacteroidia bacterium]
MRKINERYEFDPQSDELGKGGFGRVFKARDTLLGRDVVLKIAQKDNLPDKYSLVQEISRVIDFNHPNLVRYYDAVIIKDVNSFGEDVEYQIGIMEYMRNGDLRAFIKTQPSEPQIRQIVAGTLKGLGYLHEHGLIHRDIKPPNILLNIDRETITAKICDFGISKAVGSEATALSNVIGTFEYMSPEQLGSNPDQKISTNSDLWSIGILIYEMFTDDLPFGSRRSGTTDAKIIGNILAAPIPDKIAGIPQPYRQMIEACLHREADKRVSTSAELLQMLESENVPKVVPVPTPLISAIPPIKTESPAEQKPVQPAPVQPVPAPVAENSLSPQSDQSRKVKLYTVLWFLGIIPGLIFSGVFFDNNNISLINGVGEEFSGLLLAAAGFFIGGMALYRNFPRPVSGIYPSLFMIGLMGTLEAILLTFQLSITQINPWIMPGTISLVVFLYMLHKNHLHHSKSGITLTMLTVFLCALTGSFVIAEQGNAEFIAFVLGGGFLVLWLILFTSLIRGQSAHKMIWSSSKFFAILHCSRCGNFFSDLKTFDGLSFQRKRRTRSTRLLSFTLWAV